MRLYFAHDTEKNGAVTTLAARMRILGSKAPLLRVFGPVSVDSKATRPSDTESRNPWRSLRESNPCLQGENLIS